MVLNATSREQQSEEFERIYMLHFNELFHFAYHYILSDDAEDIVQEIFLKIYNNPSILSETSNKRAYMYRMVKNSCIDYLKHIGIQNVHQDKLIDSLLNNTEYDQELEEEINGRVTNCLSSLPEKQRAIIQLRLEGKDYAEISQLLNISVGTVNTHINRAYKFIKNNHLFIYLLIK